MALIPLHGFAVIYGRLSVRLSRKASVNIELIYSAHKYIALKICEQNSKSAGREIAAYEHLSLITTEHPGALFLRKLCDTFRIQGHGGNHLCLVHEPLGLSIETLRQLMPSGQLPEGLLKSLLRHLLQALDCLHRDAKMAHTGA